jgi:predicted transcriptional regulator
VKVRELYCSNVATVSKATDLAQAGSLVRRVGIGLLPVVDRADRVVGLLTERDCLVEIARRNVAPSEILVEEVMIERPPVVEENDDVLRSLDYMKRERLPLLPVVDRDDRLVGILSIEDIACQALQGALPAREIAAALCEIRRATAAEADHRSGYGRRERFAATRGRELGRLERVPLSR